METKQNPTGSGEPQAIEQILENYFATSNEPLATAFRTPHTESYQKNRAESKGCNLPRKDAESDGSIPLCNSDEANGQNPLCKEAEGDGRSPLCNSNEVVESNGRSPLCNSNEVVESDGITLPCNSDEDAEGDERNTLFKDVFPNTELDVNLKLLTRSCRRMNIGEVLPGAIIRDGEWHFTFIERAFERKEKSLVKRNPHVLQLHYINVKRKDDGTLYPTFNRPVFTQHFTFQDFCRKAARELLMVAGSVKEEELNK